MSFIIIVLLQNWSEHHQNDYTYNQSKIVSVLFYLFAQFLSATSELELAHHERLNVRVASQVTKRLKTYKKIDCKQSSNHSPYK